MSDSVRTSNTTVRAATAADTAPLSQTLARAFYDDLAVSFLA